MSWATITAAVVAPAQFRAFVRAAFAEAPGRHGYSVVNCRYCAGPQLHSRQASPGVLTKFVPNAHYPSEDAYVEALSGVMKEEYEAIHRAGADRKFRDSDVMVFPSDFWVEGNERVIRPRLADAAFFWDSDRKKALASREELLRDVVYQRGLGSLFDKSQRIGRLAGWLAEELDGCTCDDDVLVFDATCWPVGESRKTMSRQVPSSTRARTKDPRLRPCATSDRG